MNWLSLILGLVKLVLEVVRYLERRQLIKATEAATLEALFERAEVIINEAKAARLNVDLSDDALMRDPLNRANWPVDLERDTNTDRSGDPKDGV